MILYCAKQKFVGVKYLLDETRLQSFSATIDLEQCGAYLKAFEQICIGGSHAGHNGLRDIHAQLGTDDYWRLRLGVGHPGIKSEVINWVLKKPSLDHRIAIDQSIDRALKALPYFLAGDMDKATMLVHTSKPPRPKPPRPNEPPP